MADKNYMHYQLSDTGLRALHNSQFKDLSPSIHQALTELNLSEQNNNSKLSNETHDMLNVLADIGLISESTKTKNIDAPLAHSINEVSHLKSDFVKLLKADFQQDDTLWDMLINIESVNDRDGLLWFMNRIITHAPVGIRNNYKGLFRQLMELDDESV